MRRTQGPSDTVRYSHLGIQFAFVVVLGIWAGFQLDKKLSTNFFTLIGTFAGAGIGFYFLYRETRRIASARTDDDAPPDSGDARGHDDSPGGSHGDSDGATGR
jgi:F0F1-type ATP synthase assembly protein I